ncbi:hypothetical protein [Salinarimonas ramus]|uniref:EF-hand domain-containing protein n=1 Tax=Salinarimonas ramus TaxID=690164 RepID=A0A917VA36_9HYPH|nr:hypothetical protein [Salinarimonas ramus]GGK54707.1 hypothetical protein GCM10011322_46870 [Salinarimonas ramus]
MTMNWLKTTASAAALVLAVAAGPAIAQEAFSDWDADASGSISETEWNTGWSDAGVYDAWDANDDNAISEDEWTAGVGENEELWNERFGETAYGDWDADDDGALTEEEFGSGVYAGYDADESGVIEEPEFGDAGDDIGDEGLFDV